MISLGMGRLCLAVGLCCLAAVVTCAPLSPQSSSPATSDADSLLLAIQAISRARRESAKGKGHHAGRSLVRYRYPIHAKRSGPNEEDSSNDADISQLARAMALELLLQSDIRNQGLARPLLAEDDTREKKASHSSVSPSARLDDEDINKKKRMKHLLDEMSDEEQDDEDDYDAESYRALLDELDDGDVTEDVEQAIYESILQALADEGFDTNDDSLAPELDGQYKLSANKRSANWKKLPRASARWRSRFENDVLGGRHKSESDSDESEPWKSLNERFRSAVEDKVYGKGFHRSLRGSRDEIRSWAKRESPSWMPASADIRKRSTAPVPHPRLDLKEGPSSSSDLVSMARKRRSISSEQVTDKNEPVEMKQESGEDVNQINNGTDSQNKSANQVVTEKEPPVKVHSNGIRKKSVKWDDYFGYDKRSDQSDQDWLENEYYKMMAGSRRKRMPHGAHEMMKRQRPRPNSGSRSNNRTLWNNRRVWDLADVEAALDAALLAAEVQDSDGYADEDQYRMLLAGQILDQLEQEEGGQLSDTLRHKLIEAMADQDGDLILPEDHRMSALDDDDDSDEVDDDDVDPRKRTYLTPLRPLAAPEGNSRDGSRRKRYPLNTYSRSHGRRIHSEEPVLNGGDCPIVGRIVSTCNVVSHLMGGYRQLLTEPCHQYEACNLCAESNTMCESEFYTQVSTLCGPDLLCRSQSRRLVSGLGDFHEMEQDLAKGNGGHVGTLCNRDHCLARFWKRR